MSTELLTAVLFASLLFAIALGVPLVFAMGGVGLILTYFLWGHDAIFVIATRAFSLGSNFILLAIPLFVFMGAMLEKSGIASALYNTMYHWMGRVRGGLAMGTVAICAVIAAM
ncbi:MAG: TRAP transporter large permease subunit, partial [Betaproteobacteria bacterium]|nr:TRAP transporter large permease subunit [Betaproteobacteria bacterium]